MKFKSESSELDAANGGKKKTTLFVLAIIGMLIIAGGGYFALSRGGLSFLSGSSSSSGKPKQLYTCGMHPQIVKEEPGLCPICHMPLVPMKMQEPMKHDKGMKGEKTASIADLIIKVTPNVIQKMGMRTQILEKKTITREIHAVAHVDFNETRQTIINSRVNGWVEELYARFTGQSVRRGQRLAGIYSPELVSTQEEYIQIYKRMKEMPEGSDTQKQIKVLLGSARKRLKFWNISDAQIDQIEKKGKATRLLTLYSPYNGVVTKKHVIEGARIKEGMDLFEIADLSTVWAYVHIPEKDIPFVKLGLPAKMIVPQLPGKTFHGRVSFVFPYMNRKARDLKLRISFRNHKFQLRPGMYATLIIKRTLPGKYVVAPSSAIIRTGTRNIAFVYKGNGIFEPREIHTGVSDAGESIQILHGLKAGEAIVVSGQFLLDSETRIQEAIRKLRKSGGDPKKMPGGHNH